MIVAMQAGDGLVARPTLVPTTVIMSCIAMTVRPALMAVAIVIAMGVIMAVSVVVAVIMSLVVMNVAMVIDVVIMPTAAGLGRLRCSIAERSARDDGELVAQPSYFLCNRRSNRLVIDMANGHRAGSNRYRDILDPSHTPHRRVDLCRT